MKIELVKGFRDIFPPASLKKEKMIDILKQKFKEYGFLPLETPIVEYDDLLRGENESDEAISDRFRLTDRGKRKLGLRYEHTISLPRVIKENPNLKMPFKRYAVGEIFRDEALKPGRFREFPQCDVDIIGDPSMYAEAELLALAFNVLKEIKLDAEIKLNNRKLLDDILLKAGVTENHQQIAREIDKLDKQTESEVKKSVANLCSEKAADDIFKFLKKDLNYFLENEFEGSKEIKQIEELGKVYGYKTIFTPTLMRGFSYYTGPVFEVWATGIPYSLVGGGRYDRSVGKYLKKEIPATGISFGSLIEYDKIEAPGTEFLLVSLGQEASTIKLAQKLRSMGKFVTVYFGKPSKALEYANSYQIKKVIFIGENEVKSKKFMVKDMDTGKEKNLDF